MVSHRVMTVIDVLSDLADAALKEFCKLPCDKETVMDVAADITLVLRDSPLTTGQQAAVCIALAHAILENARCHHIHTSN